MRMALVALAALSTPAFAERDFSPEVSAISAVAACSAPAPAGFPAAPITVHCKRLRRTLEAWRTHWLTRAAPYFAAKLPGAPTVVIYPFGGGDAATLLGVFPDATEYTTLSLEGMGDPRPLAPAALARELPALDRVLEANLGWAWNTTNQLSADSSATGSGLPVILAIALVALEAHGYEPVRARYFALTPDGTLTYLGDPPAPAPAPANRRKRPSEVQRGLFNNIEITFRKKGDATAPTKTFRHIAADLSDTGLAADHGALAYIEQRRDFAAMTKAASYLFWKPEFARLRDTFLARMKVMVSDDTGIPPRYSVPAGFAVELYGGFRGTFFKFADQAIAAELVELWKRPVEPTLPFKFGYYDNRRTPHLMITRRLR